MQVQNADPNRAGAQDSLEAFFALAQAQLGLAVLGDIFSDDQDTILAGQADQAAGGENRAGLAGVGFVLAFGHRDPALLQHTAQKWTALRRVVPKIGFENTVPDELFAGHFKRLTHGPVGVQNHAVRRARQANQVTAGVENCREARFTLAQSLLSLFAFGDIFGIYHHQVGGDKHIRANHLPPRAGRAQHRIHFMPDDRLA